MLRLNLATMCRKSCAPFRGPFFAASPRVMVSRCANYICSLCILRNGYQYGTITKKIALPMSRLVPSSNGPPDAPFLRCHHQASISIQALYSQQLPHAFVRWCTTKSSGCNRLRTLFHRMEGVPSYVSASCTLQPHWALSPMKSSSLDAQRAKPNRMIFLHKSPRGGEFVPITVNQILTETGLKDGWSGRSILPASAFALGARQARMN